MLKIYSVTGYVSIDGTFWREVGIHNEYVALNEKPETKLLFSGVSFDELFEYLSHNYICGLKRDFTLFRSKPLIKVQYSDAWDPVYYKHFNSLLYKMEYKECDSFTRLDYEKTICRRVYPVPQGSRYDGLPYFKVKEKHYGENYDTNKKD